MGLEASERSAVGDARESWRQEARHRLRAGLDGGGLGLRKGNRRIQAASGAKAKQQPRQEQKFNKRCFSRGIKSWNFRENKMKGDVLEGMLKYR